MKTQNWWRWGLLGGLLLAGCPMSLSPDPPPPRGIVFGYSIPSNKDETGLNTAPPLSVTVEKGKAYCQGLGLPKKPCPEEWRLPE